MTQVQTQIGDVGVTYTPSHGLILVQGDNSVELSQGQAGELIDFYSPVAALERKPHITITARRWFQRTYGNTYHSVSVLVDGELAGRVDCTYGYEEAYLQTAHKILQDVGYCPKTEDSADDWYQFRMDMREYHRWHVTCTDVERKKDL